ncbi:MAG: hypothetical protein MI923_29670 [Phycisphaerales bacterium]|nr:hypothetical protein [Phycisphaerales bacterium]
MKKAAEYARRVKQLFSKIKKEKSKASLATKDDPLQMLLLGILSNYATEQKASTALSRLLDTAIDNNDLRMTPVADMVRAVGVDYPKCRLAADEISQTLNSIFNHLHHLDVGFLETGSKKAAESFLNSLDCLSPHAKAFFRQRCLKAQVIPLDHNMYTYLQKGDCIAEDVGVEEAQKFLSSAIKDRDRMSFYTLFKRYAATHSPRKSAKKSASVTERKKKTAAATKTTKKKAKKKAASSARTSGKKTTRKKKTVRSTLRKTAKKKKTASGKTKPRKTARRR